MGRSIVMKLGLQLNSGFLFNAVAVASVFLFSGPALGAPQSLGLVATVQPVPMICEGSSCTAQLSSFCLQRERKSPDFRTPYQVDKDMEIWLHLTGRDGSRRVVSAEGYTRLAATRGYTGIEVSISKADMTVLGATEVAIEVGNHAILFPQPKPGDPDPITEKERSFVKNQARRLAAGIFDAREGLGDTLSILDRMINSVTTSSRLSADDRRDLWSRVAGVPLEAAVDDRTRHAAGIFSVCLNDLERQMIFGLRNCLEGRRDELLTRTNLQFWDALAAGS